MNKTLTEQELKDYWDTIDTLDWEKMEVLAQDIISKMTHTIEAAKMEELAQDIISKMTKEQLRQHNSLNERVESGEKIYE